jgi:TPP-dependent pyruvate/acetoin dehydrogenase alpha subunit
MPSAFKPDPQQTILHHWGYHKHNLVTGPAPVATQMLHAAGIAFACKMRKTSAVTVAYCGASAVTEADFLEGVRFAAHHQLSVVFICERASSLPFPEDALPPSFLLSLKLPDGIQHQQVDGTNVISVYQTMQQAIHHARSGLGPCLLEMHVVRPHHMEDALSSYATHNALALLGSKNRSDPLVYCQSFLQEHDCWDEAWAYQTYTRLSIEVDRAWHDVLYNAAQIP